MNPPCPRSVLSWDLSTVLRALLGLLLALASVKCVGDLQALSEEPSFLEFGP